MARLLNKKIHPKRIGYQSCQCFSRVGYCTHILFDKSQVVQKIFPPQPGENIIIPCKACTGHHARIKCIYSNTFTRLRRYTLSKSRSTVNVAEFGGGIPLATAHGRMTLFRVRQPLGPCVDMLEHSSSFRGIVGVSTYENDPSVIHNLPKEKIYQQKVPQFSC